MDDRQNPPTGSSSNQQKNILNNAVPNAQPVAPAPFVANPGTSRRSDGMPHTAIGPPPSMPGPPQIARSGGIGLTTTLGRNQVAALQQLYRRPVPLPSGGSVPQSSYGGNPQHGVPSSQLDQTLQRPHQPHHHQQQQRQLQTSRPSSVSQKPGWTVPNPLLSSGVPNPGNSAVNLTQPLHNTSSGGNTRVEQQRPMMHQPTNPPPRLHTQPMVPQSSGTSYQPQTKKPKVVLSAEAKQALAKAIWSAIRSKDGSIAPDLMNAALATGLPKHAILNAARVAREREAMKRKAMLQQQQHHQQQRPPQQKHPQHFQEKQYSHQMPRPSHNMPVSSNAPMRSPPPPNKLEVKKSPPPAVSYRQPPQEKKKVVPTQLGQHVQAAKEEERAKWQHIHNGVFLTQKGRFSALPYTLSAIIRSPRLAPETTTAKAAERNKKRRRVDVTSEVLLIRGQLRSKASFDLSEELLDPEKFKRTKIEPKKYAKALDRVVRKARQSTAEALSKQHKELAKAISSHQQEFFKFHRQRRQEAHRIARSIRDSLDKEEKKREKDAAAAERARIAALKANDMDAYSKLLEETKNERLKFLMDKTERHFSQISTSLLQARNKDGSVSSAGGTGSYYASAHLKTEEVRQPSILVGGDLKEYQMSGLQWLVSLYNNKLNGILADEMGLGKTIQAISLVAYLMEFKNNLGPFLVIVPLSTLSNWVNEFTKWCPSAHLVCFKGTPAQRKQLYQDQVRMGHFNVLLTTYEYIIKDKSSLRKINWQYAIVDEGHRMKNAASKFAKTLSSQYTTKYRLLLTGTPLMNDLSELWSLLNFLLPAIFNSVDTFDQWFNRPFAQFGNTGGSAEDEANFLTNEERMFIIHRLHELLRPFMLRRVKSEVLDQLPEKVEKVLRCELSSWQKELYKQISTKAVAENASTGDSYVQPQQASRGLNNVVMQLRKVCNHPFLFSPQGYHINEKIIRSSGKVELLDRMLPKLKAAGHRVLMFTQMTAVMTILEDYFAYRGYLSLRLDGSTPAEEREKRMYKFNAPDSPYFVFLLSTRAGGLGLNLTAADTVIIYDSDWNPMMDLQAQDRAHRIGQRSDVSVFRLVTNSPVEEKILGRATEKLNMSELVVEAGKFDRRSVENDNSLERKQLMEVLLTDFDTNTLANSQDKPASEVTGSEGDDENEDENDNGSENSDKDDLNDLLSNNEADYQLYEAIDVTRKGETGSVDASLFCTPEDVPDWIRYPTGKKDAALEDSSSGDGSRKRKEVIYDDGLTEKQFLRLMEKQADGEEAARAGAKAARKAAAVVADSPVAAASQVSAAGASDLTDWTFRKLISCSKMVVALKDPSTKRRLSEIFLEKPPREQYPDYYELIEKPIAINDILRKCRGKMYADLQEFRDDWNLMFANAKAFNGEGSWVVEDGKALLRELDRVLKKNGFSEDTSKAKSKQSPPKKKLRIKLSLKTLKAKEDTSGSVGVQQEPAQQDAVVVKKRGRKPKKAKGANQETKPL